MLKEILIAVFATAVGFISGIQGLSSVYEKDCATSHVLRFKDTVYTCEVRK